MGGRETKISSRLFLNGDIAPILVNPVRKDGGFIPRPFFKKPELNQIIYYFIPALKGGAF